MSVFLCNDIDFRLIFKHLRKETHSLLLTMNGDICTKEIPFHCCVDLVLPAMCTMPLEALMPWTGFLTVVVCVTCAC